MKRREFVTLVAGAASTCLPAARAQQSPGRVYRVGYLALGSQEQQRGLADAFAEGLRGLGYRVGENLVIEYRFADGRTDRVPALAADLVGLGVDVIAAGNTANAVVAKQATATIPIIMANSIDPVGAGLVASLARPGGNVTGLTQDTGEAFTGKRLEMLKEMIPDIARLGVLWNPDFAANRNRLASMTAIAQPLGLTLVSAEARGQQALEQAFATMAAARAQAFVLYPDPLLFNYRDQICGMALRDRLPAISAAREFAEAGLLLTYGANLQDLFRRVAIFIDKIVKGAKPADLPVEQPTKFELVINRKTANALGLAIPSTLLAQADEIIE